MDWENTVRASMCVHMHASMIVCVVHQDGISDWITVAMTVTGISHPGPLLSRMQQDMTHLRCALEPGAQLARQPLTAPGCSSVLLHSLHIPTSMSRAHPPI